MKTETAIVIILLCLWFMFCSLLHDFHLLEKRVDKLEDAQSK